jgi:hypothetical protein
MANVSSDVRPALFHDWQEGTVMLESEKLAIAAHLHVVMRRKIGRVTDVEWLIRSPDYAREIIRVALGEPEQPDLHEWARRLQAALFPPAPVPPPKAAMRPMAQAVEPVAAVRRYVGSLR